MYCCPRHDRDRTLFLLFARALVRTWCWRAISIAPCHAIHFAANALRQTDPGHRRMGAGDSPGAKLHFNLTHSRGAIALAVSGGREVGIDVEERHRPVEYLALAEAASSPSRKRVTSARTTSGRFAGRLLRHLDLEGSLCQGDRPRAVISSRRVLLRYGRLPHERVSAAGRLCGARLAFPPVRAGAAPLRGAGGARRGRDHRDARLGGGVRMNKTSPQRSREFPCLGVAARASFGSNSTPVKDAKNPLAAPNLVRQRQQLVGKDAQHQSRGRTAPRRPGVK